MKVSDYVAQFIAGISSHVFGVCGGGAMHLNDSIAHQPGLKWVATHHEQAAAFAAEAYARVSNKIGVVHVTAGPGVTNTMTGVACAWADSLPMIVIAGQVDSSTLKTSEIRQLGISEVNGVALMRSITKYAVCVTNPESIVFHLQLAYSYAMSGRRGPVYLEIPLNVQGAEIDPDKCAQYTPKQQQRSLRLQSDVTELLSLLQAAKKPVLLIGNGIHLAGAEEKFNNFLANGPRIPVLCSWNGADLIPSDHPLYVGRPGLIGDRAGNFAIQEADLVIALGTRLSIPQIGHNWKDFARNAKLVMVDIDEAETKKTTLNVDLPIVADIGDFLDEFWRQNRDVKPIEKWDFLSKCQNWREKYPAILPEYAEAKDGVHSYFFLQELAKHLDEDAIVVTDVGTSFVATMQAMPMTGKQRMFHSPGIAPMGYGLPGAIGACFAAPGRQVVCLTGDGGTMFNLQELQTIVHHKLPILIVLYSNNGYKTMQVTQGNHFGREAVSSPESDISWPDFVNVVEAFGISASSCSKNSTMVEELDWVFGNKWPHFLELKLSKSQTIAPLVKTKVEAGKFVPVQLDEMWPYLEESN